MNMRKYVNYYKKMGFIQGTVFTICATSAISLATVAIPGFFNFSPGTPISSSEINSNFDKLASLIDNTRSQNYIGTWSVVTNTPDLDATSPVAGDYYIASTAGTHTFSNGENLSFAVGNWVIFNGISWEKIQVTAGAPQWTTSGANVHYSTGNVGIGTTTPGSTLDVKGTLRLSGSTSGYVGFAPAAAAGTTTYTLPSADGSAGQVLSTNGGATLSWMTPATSSAPTGSASGDLSGTYPNPTINGLAAPKIATGLIDNIEFNYLDGVTSNIQNQLTNKEILIPVGTTTQYFRGDKTWQNLDTGAIPEGANPYFTNARVLGTTLPGLTQISSPITSADTILVALGKSQGQIENKMNRFGDAVSSGVFDFNGSAVLRTLDPISLTDVTTKQYVDNTIMASSHWAGNGGNINRLTGNVGIGTINPSTQLEITNTSGHTILTESTYSSNPADTSIIALQKSMGSSGAPATIYNGDYLGQIHFKGFAAVGGSGFNTAATIESYASGPFSGSSTPAAIIFKTTAAGTTIPTERIKIDASGFVGIGTSAPTYMLEVNGQVAGTSAFLATSDFRFKKNISRVSNSFEKITALNGVYYNWKQDEFPDYNFSSNKQMGVIAQQVEKVFPEAVSTASNGYKSVAYTMLIAPIIESLKEVRQWMFTSDHKMNALISENQRMKDYLCKKDKDAPFCH